MVKRTVNVEEAVLPKGAAERQKTIDDGEMGEFEDPWEDEFDEDEGMFRCLCTYLCACTGVPAWV